MTEKHHLDPSYKVSITTTGKLQTVILLALFGWVHSRADMNMCHMKYSLFLERIANVEPT